MSNSLLSASEQAHLDTVRSIPHSPDEHTPTPQPTNAMEAVTGFLARADYHAAFIRAVQWLALAGIGFAVFKLVAIWDIYPGFAFLPFLDMHTPLMLFSGLFTFNYIQHRETEGVAIIALLSTLLNALLV